MIAITTLLAVVAITLIVNRVGSIALVSTGLSAEVTHFQARSALTGVGFSTAESELIVNHPVRRRIVLSCVRGRDGSRLRLAGVPCDSASTDRNRGRRRSLSRVR
jgi:hypothetical protein